MEKKCLSPLPAWGGKRRQTFFSLLFILSFTSLFAQTPIRVGGTVKDSKGAAISGASVNVKGGLSGTTTDSSGQFSITVPSQASVLIFSYVGFLPKEQTVGSQQAINITLSEKNNDLEEIVVIGYGQTAKKRDLTAAISSINSKQIEERQPVNLFDALQGQAAGVLIINDGGGAPGAEGTIQVRGASSLNAGNGPLYLVDGVINPNGATINPMDIERVEVLKDAASASIYGVRGANGVILITTKKGKAGRPRIDASYSHVYGKLAHKLPQNNSAEVRAFRRIQSANPSGSTGGNTDSLNPGFNSDNDLQELLLGNLGHKTQANIGIGGGQKGLTFYAGISFLDDKSIILNSWFKRVQARINMEYEASKRLTYSTNMSFSWQNGNTIPVGRTVNVAFDRPAFSRIYYPDGSLTSYIGSKRNPVANALYEKHLAQSYIAQFNNQLLFQVYKDLKWTNMFNAILKNEQALEFSPRFVSANKDVNSGENEINKDFQWEYQSFLNFNKTINGDHSFQALAGFSADRRRYDEEHSEYANIVNEEIFVTSPAYITPLASYSSATANTTASLFGRLNYSYKGRYIISGSFRRDGSSRFIAPDTKWGNFYSASAAWRFSDEKFMDWSRGFLNDAKLRFSFGQLGNDNIGDFEGFTKVSFPLSYNGVGGAVIGYKKDDNRWKLVFGNPEIHWETVQQKNAGIDLSFLKGRLQFTADVYDKTTIELLYARDIPAETGYPKTTVNVGSVQNRGLEFVVSATPLTKKRFIWNVTGNISFERGTIKELDKGVPFTAGNKWYVEQGGRIGNFFGWTNLGVYQWDESNAYTDDWQKLTVVLDRNGKPQYTNGKPDYTINGQPYSGYVHSLYDPGGKFRGGDAEWLNMNNDSLINDADRHIIGNAQPDFYLGIINNVTYQRFSLSFLFNASFGSQIYNTLKYNHNYPSNTGAGSPDMVYNSWRQQGDIAKYPYYPERTNRGSLKTNGNSLYIEDGSFIRLSSARLAYSLDPKIAKKIFMKSLTAYVFGTNLLTWTNYSGYDPEFSSGNVLTPGDDSGKYPKRREVGLGINVNF